MQQTDPRVDRCRGAVYQAEDTIASVMGRSHRAVRVGRRVLTLPETTRFGTVATVQAYVEAVLARPATAAAYPGVGPIVVEAKKGFRSATYSSGVIHLPAGDPRGRWSMTQAVVLHEVAHHLAGVLGHGREFQRALVHLYREHLGSGAAELLEHLFLPLSELPELVVVDGGDVPTRRVAALLAKAQSTASPEESEAYLAKAAEVAQRHSVDLAVAAMNRSARAEQPTHRMLTIGDPRRALNKLLVALYVQIARAWAVNVDIGHGSTYVLGFGMPADLDQVEAVFATASTLMVARSQQHVRSGAWRGETYLPPDSRRPRPVTATVARNAFCLGFVQRLGQRLAASAEHARREAAAGVGSRVSAPGGAGAEASPGGSGAGAERVAIALRQRELAVSDYHRAVSRARGSWRGSASAAGSAQGSRRAGARAADEFDRRAVDGGRRAIGA